MTPRLKVSEIAINLLVFMGLFYGTFVAFPHVATMQHYSGAQNVSSLFPIAVMEDGKPAIVKWAQYQRHPAHYQKKIIFTPLQDRYQTSESEFFTLKRGENNVLNLVFKEEDYTFWASYSVDSGQITPLSFRFTGAFVIMYCLLVSFIGTPLINWLRVRFIGTRTQNSAKCA